MSERLFPDSWVEVTLGEITEPVEKVLPAKEPKKEIRYLDISGIDNASNRVTEAKTYAGSAAPSRARQLVKEGDVLFSTVRTYLKNIARVPSEYEGQVASTGFSVLRPSKGILSEYLFAYTLTPMLLEPLAALQRGSSYPAVREQDVRSQTIPLPPLAEQKRIVAKIEELFSELDAGEESLRRARRQLGVYRQSLLKQAFEGKLTAPWREQHPDLLESPDQLLARIQAERQACYQQQLKEWEKAVKVWKKTGEEGKRANKPREPEEPTRLSPEETAELLELPRGWCWMTLESLSSPEPRSIQSGPFGSSLKHEEFTDEGILVIGIDNVQKGYFSPGSQNRISPEKYSELEKYTARPKDFLITVMATVGRCCRIPDEIETAIITKHVYRVSPNLDLIDPDYLVNSALGCPAIVLQIEKDKFGQTRPGLNGGFIKALPVPLCSLPEQQEIVRLLDAQFEVIEQNEREIDAALKRSEALRQSILKKAFTGQLVPQDPTDEPASALLERIRKEREGLAASKQPKKKVAFKQP